MTFEFDRDTAVRAGESGKYHAELAAGWSVGGGLNGGYLLAVIGRAVRASMPAKRDPIAVSAHYLSASTAGAATVSTRLLREGKSLATIGADLCQDGEIRISALATYGSLERHGSDILTTAQEPTFAPLEECIPISMAPAQVRELAPFMERFDIRTDPACFGWASGKPSGNAWIQSWVRFADQRQPDPISLLTMADVLAPVTFEMDMPGWAPTIELSAHVRAVPAPGWLKVRHETRNMAGGLFEEDCEVWDSAGRLVVQSRQLARAPR